MPYVFKYLASELAGMIPPDPPCHLRLALWPPGGQSLTA